MSTPVKPFSQPPLDIEPEEKAHFRAKRQRRLVQVGVAVVLVIALTAGAAWATGWFTHSPNTLGLDPKCSGDVNLTGSGSTFVAPLMQMWTGAYAGSKGCVTVRIAYNSSSAEEGVAQLISGSTDFATTEEPLNATTLASFPAPVLTLPIATGALAISYNVPGVPSGLNLTGAVLAGIYLGEITAWNDSAIAAINPGVHLPSSLTITPIHGAPGSSTNYVLSGYLSRSNATWSSDIGQSATLSWPVGIEANGDGGTASTLQATPGGIAYVGLAYAQEDGLTYAKVQNPAGVFVAPSSANVTSAVLASDGGLPLGNESWQNVSLLDGGGNVSYPLTTFTYAISYTDLVHTGHGLLPKNSALWLASFLYWISVDAQYYAPPLSFASLPAHVTTGDVQIVELLRYDGSSALGDIDSDGD
ncbi:MAG: phosphate ABC transporter substrate-binding protein PstS [Thermoplasmata archaeon]|nr:phosphate ABC transporter substrate-binding protein PstS [Thermoplasmata archaeon]